MATVHFENNDTLIAMLKKVAQATGNSKLDVGYQCRDMRPYFRFSRYNTVEGTTAIYYVTKVPKEGKVYENVPIYEKGPLVQREGQLYYTMNMVGYGRLNGMSLTFNDGGTIKPVYAYDNTYEEIRGFFINKWSLNKPITTLLSEAFDGEDLDYGYTIAVTTGFSNFRDSDDNKEWMYVPVKHVGQSRARLRDFEGYDSGAVYPFGLEMTEPFREAETRAIKFNGATLLEEVVTRWGTFTAQGLKHLHWYMPQGGLQYIGEVTQGWGDTYKRLNYTAPSYMLDGEYDIFLVLADSKAADYGEWSTPVSDYTTKFAVVGMAQKITFKEPPPSLDGLNIEKVEATYMYDVDTGDGSLTFRNLYMRFNMWADYGPARSVALDYYFEGFHLGSATNVLTSQAVAPMEFSFPGSFGGQDYGSAGPITISVVVSYNGESQSRDIYADPTY